MTALVQLVANDGNSATLATSVSVTAGNAYVITTTAWNSGNTPIEISSVTDNASGGGNTWAYSTSDSSQNPPAAGVYDSAQGTYAFSAIAVCLPADQASGGTKAFTSVTITYSVAPGYAELAAMEFSGVPAGSVILAAASTVTIASGVESYTTPAIAPSAASLGIATTSDYNGEFTGVTSGWTIINSGDTIGAYGLSVGPGGVSPTFTMASAHDVPTSCVLAIGPPPSGARGRQVRQARPARRVRPSAKGRPGSAVVPTTVTSAGTAGMAGPGTSGYATAGGVGSVGSAGMGAPGASGAAGEKITSSGSAGMPAPGVSGTAADTGSITSTGTAGMGRLGVSGQSPTGFQPTGPGGSWELVFDDEFDYSGPPDPSRWGQLVGNGINGTSCLGDASCSVVSDGILYLTVASATQGAYISSNPLDGAGANGWAMPPGGCVEARIFLPGATDAVPYNWGGYFASGEDWPVNGEIDICEVNEYGIDVNYHYESGGEQQSGPYNPPGNWANAWHTFTAVRGTSTVTFYWDGVNVREWSTDDAGGAMSILPCNGTGGGGTMYGTEYAVQMDYVRGWIPGSGPPPTPGPEVVQNVLLPGESSATISASGFTTTTGNTLALSLGCWSTLDTPISIASITDSAGNTWAHSTSAYNQNPPAAGSWDSAIGLYGFCALASCIAAESIDSITVVFAATAVNWCEGCVTEVTDLPSGSVVLAGSADDTIATGVTAYTPPSVTVSSPGTVLVVALSSAVDADFTAATNGFTVLNIGDAIGAYNVASAAGTLSTELTGASSCNVPSGVTLAIGPPAGGGGGSLPGLVMASII